MPIHGYRAAAHATSRQPSLLALTSKRHVGYHRASPSTLRQSFPLRLPLAVDMEKLCANLWWSCTVVAMFFTKVVPMAK